MKRILVFDFGLGGEQVADYLEHELSVVEVVRLIDWCNPTCDELFPAEVPRLVERLIRPYVGRFNLIILGGYVASLALPLLKRLFPEQLFLGVGVSYQQIFKNTNRTQRIVALASPALLESAWFDNFCARLPSLELQMPNCAGWEQLINDREVSPELLRADLTESLGINFDQHRASHHRGRPKSTALPLIEQMSITNSSQGNGRTATQNFLQIRNFAQNSPNFNTFAQNLSALSNFAVAKKTPAISEAQLPDVAILLDTHFWLVKRELENIFGWRVKVLDFREKLLHDVCAALKLRGVHGGRQR